MKCCISFGRHLLILTNSLSLLGGVAVLGVGLFTLLHPSAIALRDLTSPTLSYLAMIVGVVVSLIAFLGLKGAMKKNATLLKVVFLNFYIYV